MDILQSYPQPPLTTFSPGWAAWTRHFLAEQMLPLEQHILPHLENADAIHWVEIGSHEGRSACWVLQHILQHPRDRILCIDPWDDIETQMRFEANIAALGETERLHTKQASSHRVTSDHIRNRFDGPAHVVYIDGCHRATSVLRDAILAWDSIDPGGFIVFDDYPLNQGPENHPRPGIDTFCKLWGPQIQILHRGWNIIIRKK